MVRNSIATNDVIVKKDGAIYFTDGPNCGGLRLQCKDPEVGIDYPGVFMWKDGKTKAIAKNVEGANGLALSPDESISMQMASVWSENIRYYQTIPSTSQTWK